MTTDVDIIADVARALNQSVDVRQALDAVLVRVAEFLQLSTGWVWIVGDDGEFELAAARNLPAGLRGDPRWTAGNCWCQGRFRDGRLDAGNVAVIECSRLAGLSDGGEGFRAHGSVAIEADGERLGILNLASRDWRQLGEDELRLLRVVSDMLAVALQRARLYERSVEIGALEERARVSREIHDGVAQTLTALVLRLESLETSTEGSEEREELRRAVELARAGLESTRTAVAELRESPFSGRLGAAVERVINEARARSGLVIDSRAEVAMEPPRRAIHATCRILQEALNNVLKHADAERVSVELVADSDVLELVVRDDGRGIDFAAVDGGYGLRGMRERAHLIGGELLVDSSDGGTTVTFRRREP